MRKSEEQIASEVFRISGEPLNPHKAMSISWREEIEEKKYYCNWTYADVLMFDKKVVAKFDTSCIHTYTFFDEVYKNITVCPNCKREIKREE